ncbi:hypothetical protein LCAA2362_1058 [Lacticaseibacillus casei A2-362]|nr:hypothetical protein LPL9_2234 [Lacticaseibacillus paracasei]EKQ05699.1 hypothetical protein LCACRF28_1499 [Lacticaseibacillus paracasei]EKQ09787.1 hypothetical protein LCAA2362_1058 [Lacticaseibacillus casei A2-362]KTE98589.1 hypothetical protein AC564_1666c [Lacticaseibacillus paracasei]QHV91286.1 hypothetical protein EOK76_g0819 [Lacticaseibacillus paracasei]
MIKKWIKQQYGAGRAVFNHHATSKLSESVWQAQYVFSRLEKGII